ncbi:helix-turn-helix domain-containing protein [Nocardia sp. ET3-3]|uniref:Helix-turn-helix domain-containing protein n=1 Tax=Nocardia terrae TaxID=2675851 RepID=A0A7K1V8Q3_9NOCA|nr:helix-turn-helix domain-containing protein [Nocardia terrae]MVU82862.1 helix-turn-helix domain-containing protein [Nocardia terrae]
MQSRENTPGRPSMIERMTQVLDVFGAETAPVGLDAVAAATGLPRTTAYRIIRELVRLEWLEPDCGGHRLGRRAFDLTARQPECAELRAAAGPGLLALHRSTGVGAHLGVLEGRRIRYLDKVGTTSAVPPLSGVRIAADRTAPGWAVLATMGPERVDALFTTRRPDHLRQLHSRLHRTRTRHGLAVSEADRCPMRIVSIAAPVLHPDGAVLGAISATGPGLRVDRLGPLVLAAARRTTEALRARDAR